MVCVALAIGSDVRGGTGALGDRNAAAVVGVDNPADDPWPVGIMFARDLVRASGAPRTGVVRTSDGMVYQASATLCRCHRVSAAPAVAGGGFLDVAHEP